MFDTLHIFSPSAPHEEAFIVGTPTNLLRLAFSLIKAAIFRFSAVSFFHSDGEGYAVFSISISGNEGDNLQVPYTHEFFIDNNPDRFHPYKLVSFVHGKYIRKPQEKEDD